MCTCVYIYIYTHILRHMNIDEFMNLFVSLYLFAFIHFVYLFMAFDGPLEAQALESEVKPLVGAKARSVEASS